MAKATSEHNGLTKILIYLVGVMVAGIASIAIAQGILHVKQDGHPVLVERVGALQSTVNEIRTDVKTLLGRSP